jgi:predicted nucleotidyltransferase
MAIPELDEHGLLPMGVHDASLEEIRERFGRFHGSDRRVRLFEALERFVDETKMARLVQEVIVNGSFVTGESKPSDIDLILVLGEQVDFSRDLKPSEYNVVSHKRVKQRYGFDVLYATASPESIDPLVEFLSQVRGRPGLRKGMVRVRP